MDNHVKIEGHPDLLRDKHSKGVINTNAVEYQKYMNIQLAKKSEKMKIQNMCDEINTLKDEMRDIKHMLIQVLEK
jgi:hypothetical protein